MALVANAQGVVTGKFTIPANVSAGSKEVRFLGAGGSNGTASFFGQGTLEESVKQRTINRTVTYYDPLAQTFFLNEQRQLVGVDLYLAKKGTSPVTVHIRETLNGYPAQGILAEAVLPLSAQTEGQWNRWLFPQPVTLQGNTEYCAVVMCDDATAEIGIATLGGWGLESQQWVTSQSPNVGVLFSSSNNQTWTAHQDKDMAIKLLAARYTATERVIDLGTVPATAHTDALLLANADTPSAETGVALEIHTPSGEIIEASDSQAVSFSPAITGNVNLKARIRATALASATLYPGTQLALGTLQTSADYISRAFDADAADSDVRVTFSANLPSGSSVKVFLANETNPPAWEEITQESAPVHIGDGVYEFKYLKPAFNQARCRVRLQLLGNNTARPRVMNLRTSVS